MHKTVHVVDDDASLRTALSRLLMASGYRAVAWESADAFLASDAMQAGGCILLDVNMPGLSGVGLQEALNARRCTMPVIFLTGEGDIPTSVRTMKAGAEDFLTKPVDQEALLGALERAWEKYGERQATDARRRELEERAATLTVREREVFELVIAGLLNKQIADRLGNTERTVKAHRASLMEKMRADSVAELVRMATELGIAQGS